MIGDTITIYDKPGILAAQVLDNETTLSGLKDLALHPEGLTLKERSSLSDRLMQGKSANIFQKTLVSTLTNPFVWLYFLTTPAGANLAKDGVSLFGRSAVHRAKDATKKIPGLLQAMDMITANQMSDNAPELQYALRHVSKSLHRQELKRGIANGDILTKFFKEQKLSSGLNLNAYAKGSPEWVRASEITQMLGVRGQGWHRDLEREVIGSDTVYVHRIDNDTGDGVIETVLDRHEYDKGKERLAKQKRERAQAFEDYDVAKRKWEAQNVKMGIPYEKWVDKPKPPRIKKEEVVRLSTIETEKINIPHKLTESDLQKSFAKYPGLEKIYWSGQKDMREAMIYAMGKEGVAGVNKFTSWAGNKIEELRKFVLDEGKLRRLVRSYSNEVVNEQALVSAVDKELVQGRAMMTKILSPDTMIAIKSGLISDADLMKIVKKTMSPIENGSEFMPLNIVEGFSTPHVRASVDAQKVVNNYGFVINPKVAGTMTPATLESMVEEGGRVMWHPEDLEQIGSRWGHEADGTMNEHMDDMILRNVSRLESRDKLGLPSVVYRMDGAKSVNKYVTDLNVTGAVHTEKVEQGLIDVWEAGRKQLPADIAGRRVGTPNPFNPDAERTLGGDMPRHQGSVDASPADMISYGYLAKLDPHSQKSFASTFMPMILHGQTDIRHSVSTGAFYEAKRTLGSLAKTTPFQMLRNSGDSGRRFVDKMVHLSDPETPMGGGVGVSGILAKGLYVSHLGLNLGSVTMNGIQPFLLAGTALGFKNVVHGYAAAMREMIGYAKDRVATHGFRLITPTQRDVLIRKNFKWAEESNIMSSLSSTLDAIENTSFHKRGGKLDQLLFDLPLKMFEKGEWLNRSVAAHAVDNYFKNAEGLVSSAGKVIRTSAYDRRNTIERFVEETQFGMTNMNTPEAFLKSRYLNNPLMRMFLGFQLRSFTGLVHTLPRMGGGYRNVAALSPLRLLGKKTITSYPGILFNDTMRGMGMSAMLYEGAKGLLGMDLSRGLFASSSTELLGLGAITNPNEDFLPIPPIVDIPIDFMRGFASGDMQAMQLSASRLFPGGIGISRALTILPDLKVPILAQMQRRSVGWDKALPDGSVPVYDWDGSLIAYKNPLDVVLSGLGVDKGRFKKNGGVDAFLVSNRDNMVGYRRKYIQSFEANDFQKAEAIAAEYKKRFGIPLTVTKAQLKSFRKLREVPRSERLVDRMEKAIRPEMAITVQQSKSQTLPVDLRLGPTAAARRQADGDQGEGKKQFAPFVPPQGF